MPMLTDFDIAAFFAEWHQLPHDDYLRFVYDFVPTIDPRKAAAGLCAEQSTAMWRRSRVQEDLRAAHGAKVVELAPLDTAATRWRMVVAHPHRNFGPRLPNMLVAAAGEGTFYAPGITTIKLIDIQFPDTYLAHFEGPQFGLVGVRDRLHIHDRPLFVGVVKPNLGLSPAAFADVAYEGWCGGLDMCKDDEMQADTAWSPLVERVRAVTRARTRAEAETGARKVFIANITDEADRLPTHCRDVTAAGASMVMINPMWTGMSAVRTLRAISEVPLMGHFAGIAAAAHQPQFGISSAVFTTLMRIAGADLIVIAGFGERMQTPDEEIRANIAACLDPLGSIVPAFPVPGGSTTVATVRDMAERIGHTDFAFIAGRGIFAHPDGPRVGARTFCAAWRSCDVPPRVAASPLVVDPSLR